MIPRLRVVLPRFRSPRSPFLLGSAAVHVALAFLIVFFPSFGSDRQIPDDFIVVTPVAEIPGEPAAEVSPPAPDVAAPEPEPETARVEDRVPEVVEKPKQEKPKPKPPERKPTPARTVPPEPAREGTPGEPGGGGRPGVDIASVGLEDLEYAWYRDQMAAALKSRWRRPALDGVRESVVVTIAFEILRNGTVHDPRIAAPSGIPSLDRSALRAVIEASPLPPLPPGTSESSVRATANFRWHPGD